MNYLAHTLLARDCPQSRLGNLLGDFAKGLDVDALPPAVQEGVWQHRAVDRFVDAHPVFRRSRARLDRRFARFSGILVDVFYDHFLARDWERHAPGIALNDFTTSVYDAIDAHRPLLPARLERLAPAMRRDDWLASYADPANVDRALHGLSRRMRRANPMTEAGPQLRAHHAGLRADFEELFVDATDFSRRWQEDVETAAAER